MVAFKPETDQNGGRINIVIGEPDIFQQTDIIVGDVNSA